MGRADNGPSSYVDIGEQERLLADACREAKLEAAEMHRSLSRSDAMDALRHAAIMLDQLRTSHLSPKYYYRLYVDVTNELRSLESWLVDENQRNIVKSTKLYEFVQHSAHIVPRLYLMVLIGVVDMRFGGTPVDDVLSDLVEMCRGVQHPLRGLFLRHYLLQAVKPYMPHAAENGNSENSVPTGTFDRMIEFILLNFAEMNKLWVRMQHQGPSKEREKREAERQELRILVGTNLVRLSQLEQLDQAAYEERILGRILEQIVSCHDAIAQEYLMECVIQVFAEEWHLASVDRLLEAAGQLAAGVRVRNVLAQLVDRLGARLDDTASPLSTDQLQELFRTFEARAAEILSVHPNMPPEDVVGLHQSLLQLAQRCDNSANSHLTDTVLKSLLAVLLKKGVKTLTLGSPGGADLARLLRDLCDRWADVQRLARLNGVKPLLSLLNSQGYAHTVLHFVQNMLDSEARVQQEEDVERVFDLIECIVSGEPSSAGADQATTSNSQWDAEEVEEQATAVSRLVHLVQASTSQTQLKLLAKVRQILSQSPSDRKHRTLPSVVVALYRLAEEMKQSFASDPHSDEWRNGARDLFVTAMSTIAEIAKSGGAGHFCMALYVDGALAADRLHVPDSATITYEFFTRAWSHYEDDIADSAARASSLGRIIGALTATQHLADDAWLPLAGQCGLAAQQLIKKTDQVRALLQCAELHWWGKTEGGQRREDSTKVDQLLSRASKVSSSCLEWSMQGEQRVEVLEGALRFAELSSGGVSAELLDSLESGVQEALVAAPNPQISRRLATLATRRRAIVPSNH